MVGTKVPVVGGIGVVCFIPILLASNMFPIPPVSWTDALLILYLFIYSLNVPIGENYTSAQTERGRYSSCPLQHMIP